MIRANLLLFGAFGLLLLALLCLSMVAGYCTACAFHGLSRLAVTVLVVAAAVVSSVLVVTVWRTQRLWRLCRISATEPPRTVEQACQQLAVDPKQVLCVAQTEPAVFRIGWWQPHIVISTGLLANVSAVELTAILAHERHHQQQRDPLRLLVMMLIRSALFPLPVIHDLYHIFLVLIEVEADQAAIQKVGRSSVAKALYKVLTQPSNRAALPQLTPVASFQACATRLAYLLDPQQQPVLSLSKVRVTLSILPFLLLCLTMLIVGH